MMCSEMAASQNYFDIISGARPGFVTDLEEGMDYCEYRLDDGISFYYLPKELIRGYSLSNYGYQLIPKIYGVQAFSELENQLAIPFEETGISQARSGPLELTGLNTLIGVVDTGIRFSNSAFLDENELSRLAVFWDQTGDHDENLSNVLYGKEYFKDELQRMVDEQADTNRFDTDGHGTALASVMAMASPLAELAAVKVKNAKRNLLEYYGVTDETKAYAETDIMLAVQYLVEYAASQNKPIVICVGFGTNYGSHEGEGALQQYLERCGAKTGVVVVVPAGNETDSAHHSKAQNNVEIRVGEGRGNFLLECWSEITTRYLLDIRTPGGEILAGIDTRNGITATYEFVFDQTLLFISAALVERGNGRSLIIIRFQNPTAGLWSLQFQSIENNIANYEFDLWLPISDFLSRQCTFLTPSIETTITEPGTARRVITVGAYSDENGSIAPFSGRGPAVGGLTLPDFCAPGIAVPTALGAYSGTGIAAAIVTGAISLFMEWAVGRGYIPYINSTTAKNLFLLGAKREKNIIYPNNIWGYGKLDLIGVFEKIAGIVY